MSAGDLTIQAGLALQQVSMLGITHVERGASLRQWHGGLPEVEQDAFLLAHPD